MYGATGPAIHGGHSTKDGFTPSQKTARLLCAVTLSTATTANGLELTNSPNGPPNNPSKIKAGQGSKGRGSPGGGGVAMGKGVVNC